MATKKAPSNKIAGVVKVAETLGAIAGTVVARKEQFVKKAGEVIDTAKAKWQSFTGPKKSAPKKAKKAVKKAVKKAKVSVKKAAKKVAKKAATVKKNVKANTRSVKKAAKKAGNK